MAQPSFNRVPSRAWVIVTASLLLSGCTVGPDFERPASSTRENWSSLGETASSRPVTSVPNHEPADVATWWTTFNDPLLAKLVEQAYAGNLTLGQAEARVRQARAARTVVASAGVPDIGAAASASRSRSSGGQTGNFFTAGFDASWEIDVFGGIRRGVEAAEADIAAAQYDRESLMVTLAGEVATTYFNLRGQQRQLNIARQNFEAQLRTLALTEQRFEAGFVSALDVANARANSTQTESQIPNYDAQIRSSIYALSVLLGREPSALLADLSPDAPLPAVPAAIPVGLPSDLLQRRPDIRRADADLHAATARVGVAVADQYPRFSITGSFGTQGGQFESLGTIANRFWSIGPAVSLPIFTGGRIQANIEQAKAIVEQATFAYRQTVLVALQDVETSLVNFTREQQRREALIDSATASRRAVDLALALYNGGRTNFLDVLSAQRQLYASEALLAQSDTTVATNLIALYKALGGGWDAAAASEAAAAK